MRPTYRLILLEFFRYNFENQTPTIHTKYRYIHSYNYLIYKLHQNTRLEFINIYYYYYYGVLCLFKFYRLLARSRM